MAKWILTGSRFCYRDADDVLVIAKRGAEVELSREQEQRLKAGEPGSPFQRREDVVEPETETVAVANEATLPAEDGFQASPVGTANRKIPAVARPERPATKAEEGGETAKPVTTASRTAAAKK